MYVPNTFWHCVDKIEGTENMDSTNGNSYRLKSLTQKDMKEVQPYTTKCSVVQTSMQKPRKQNITHRQLKNTYVRMLLIDYSSAFNTIVPLKAHQ
jgi:hypothetical protein